MPPSRRYKSPPSDVVSFLFYGFKLIVYSGNILLFNSAYGNVPNHFPLFNLIIHIL